MVSLNSKGFGGNDDEGGFRRKENGRLIRYWLAAYPAVRLLARIVDDAVRSGPGRSIVVSDRGQGG